MLWVACHLRYFSKQMAAFGDKRWGNSRPMTWSSGALPPFKTLGRAHWPFRAADYFSIAPVPEPGSVTKREIQGFC
jgi:hypothetical protein